MASDAEARIRAKAERLLREHWPDARIIHEFELGGVRLDLAAITEDRLVLVEIKSERDTLTRLERQVKWGVAFGGPMLICFAEKWREPIRQFRAGNTDLYRAEWLEETEDGFSGVVPGRLAGRHDRYNSRLLLGLLLKPELLELVRPLGGKSRHTVYDLAQMAHEHLTGQQIRQGVFAALRARAFGWTCDPPIQLAA